MTDDVDTILAELESWENEKDYALRQAQKVLDHATEQFIAGELHEPEAVSILAEAWRDLASDWMHRQSHQVDLQFGIDQLGDDSDETGGAA